MIVSTEAFHSQRRINIFGRVWMPIALNPEQLSLISLSNRFARIVNDSYHNKCKEECGIPVWTTWPLCSQRKNYFSYYGFYSRFPTNLVPISIVEGHCMALSNFIVFFGRTEAKMIAALTIIKASKCIIAMVLYKQAVCISLYAAALGE